MDRTELAWAAGFWDGEGSAYLTGSNDRVTKQPQARINQSSTSGVPAVLTRFQRAVGFGSVQGPDLVEGREPLYRWVVSSRALVEELLLRMWPWLGHVKRTQLQQTLKHPVETARRIAIADRHELVAWCAGLFDGEGSTYLARHQSHAGYVLLEAAITQSSREGPPEVLERFLEAVGVGKIYGPYGGDAQWAPVYRWKAHRRDQIESLIALLGDQLGEVKRRQAAAAIAVVAAQAPLPRGNPAWGSHKTRCVNGHEYATARVRPYRSRNGHGAEPRASKQCLVCVREQARVRRRQKKRNSGNRRSKAS